ncbi:DNA sulfur modification protein DndB [Micromonospora marina]|uniref:DNA sulfur modification protein DndB n=1 Tax=Micromonospora marina TaxID=307120 RepID=A0A1C5AL89_9ACTN|nr:DNA sulfur modification protein DndB [Micromonospora marina]SCF45831.1 DNA sulfur modification protein DndB [Micromonospora marina]
MPSKTFVPAFKAHVGDWEYYLCLMSYAQVAREINFAYELGGNKDLATMIQRGVGDRTEAITQYLLTNEHRFLGSLIVAAWGGHPEYIALTMDDNAEQNMLAGVDREFGVLTFDGTHQFFALDGQHRLKAIKDAVKRDPELGSEDIGVIVVPHFNSEEGRRRTRRLFTNINRNAVKTSTQENIALDEDDSFAILTRRFLDDHPFLSQPNVVQVFSKQGSDGEVKLANRNVNVSQSAWTTIGILYDLLKEMGFDLDGSIQKLSKRATDEVLDESYEILVERLNQLFIACGDLRARYEKTGSPRELRAPKDHDGNGHPFMRPVVQLAVARALRHVVSQGLLDWDSAINRLSSLDWRLVATPFATVWQSGEAGRRGRMITGKEHVNLLQELLTAHIAPANKAQIERALKSYKVLRGIRYPISVEELAKGIVTSTASVFIPKPAHAPAPAVSNDVDIDVEDDEEEQEPAANSSTQS